MFVTETGAVAKHPLFLYFLLSLPSEKATRRDPSSFTSSHKTEARSSSQDWNIWLLSATQPTSS